MRFEVSVVTGDTATTVAAKLADVVNKTLGLSDFKFFTASAASGVLTLTAADCHIRFIAGVTALDKVLDSTDESLDPGAAWSGYMSYVPVVALAEENIEHGDCGAGTVEHLIKDLRIPTNASINPFAADQGGRPIPGGKYDQVLIEYETPRHHVAGGVMGSVAEVSRTSHVLFLESGIAAAIEEILSALVPSAGVLENYTVAEGEDPVLPVDSDRVDEDDQNIASAKQEPGSVQ
jgi:hypothetical protein